MVILNILVFVGIKASLSAFMSSGLYLRQSAKILRHEFSLSAWAEALEPQEWEMTFDRAIPFDGFSPWPARKSDELIKISQKPLRA